MENKDLMDILLEVYHDKNAEVRITRKQMKNFFLDLFTGGTNTTSDGILWILAELVSHPAAFKKLREEIDSVVGTERLVDEADIPSMPYFQACVKEAMRVNPPAYVPFGGGRRMCPGINMSSSLINCSVTAVVQCFDWKVLGGDGPDGSKVNMDTKPGVVKSMAKPFMAIPVLRRNLFSV
ncbi:hypothetical protein OIU76_014993 [Salix suchowensis]|nr:hypothetical protein OIU76_014993 [Salix suchowensis]